MKVFLAEIHFSGGGVISTSCNSSDVSAPKYKEYYKQELGPAQHYAPVGHLGMRMGFHVWIVDLQDPKAARVRFTAVLSSGSSLRHEGCVRASLFPCAPIHFQPSHIAGSKSHFSIARISISVAFLKDRDSFLKKVSIPLSN